MKWTQMLLDNVEVRQSASKSLVQIAKLLPEEVIHQDVLRIVLHLAHDEMDEHKITALPLLVDLAPVVGPKICANYLASDLHALSQITRSVFERQLCKFLEQCVPKWGN